MTRYGGDEFIIILLGANPNTAVLAAERIRKLIEATKFFVDERTAVNITASIGVATFPDHATDKAQLLAIADETMYEGKRDGKNKVTIVGRKQAAIADRNINA